MLDRTIETQFRVVCVLATIATADLVWRWAGQTPAQRRGLGWLAIASGLMTATFIPLALPQSWVADLPDWLTPVLHLTSQLFFPAALLVAVLGQRIRGLEFIIGRATLWGLLTGVLVAVYVGIVAIGGALLPDVEGVVVAVATAAVALLFMPVRGSAQRHIDALVRGEGADAGASLRRRRSAPRVGRGRHRTDRRDERVGDARPPARRSRHRGRLAERRAPPGVGRRTQS